MSMRIPSGDNGSKYGIYDSYDIPTPTVTSPGEDPTGTAVTPSDVASSSIPPESEDNEPSLDPKDKTDNGQQKPSFWWQVFHPFSKKNK